MPSESRNLSEQEQSIKARAHELYVEPERPASVKPVKPLPAYLRETPAVPLSTSAKVVLSIVGIVVALLFLAAIWRVSHRYGPKQQTQAPQPAVGTAMPTRTRDAPYIPVFYSTEGDAERYQLKGLTDDDFLPDRSDQLGTRRESRVFLVTSGTGPGR